MTEAPERIWAYEYCNQIFAARSPTWFPFWADARAYVPDRADLPAAVTVDRETIARAICAERCAVYGEPPCYTVEDAPWPNPDCGDCDCHDMADAVLSCLTTQPDPVKPLEWQGPYACNGYRKGNWKAREFSIQREGKNRYRLFKNHIDRHETVFETLGEAKAAAQADYERRILSCHTTQPDPVKDAAHSPIYDLIPLAIQEAQKGMRKFPQPNYVISKWAEETGEVTKALIHNAEGRESLEAVKGEIVQALAMLHRLFVEGDRVHGLRALAEQEQSDE